MNTKEQLAGIPLGPSGSASPRGNETAPGAWASRREPGRPARTASCSFGFSSAARVPLQLRLRAGCSLGKTHSCVFSERSRAERRRGRWSRGAEPAEWRRSSGGICTPSAAMSGRSWILPTSWATWLPGLGTVSGCRLSLGARKQFRTYFLFPFHPHPGLSINRVNAGFVARSLQYFRLGIVKTLRSPWRPRWGNWVPAKWNDLLRAAYLFKLKSWGNMSLSVSFIYANSYVRLLCWSLGWHQRFRIRYKPFLKIL